MAKAAKTNIIRYGDILLVPHLSFRTPLP